MKIINLTKGTNIALDCMLADNFFSRFLGLMGKKNLQKGSGLLITKCNSIHMLFMKFPLDLIFVDKDYKVVSIMKNILPWKISGFIKNAVHVIELPVGTIDMSGTEVLDVLKRL